MDYLLGPLLCQGHFYPREILGSLLKENVLENRCRRVFNKKETLQHAFFRRGNSPLFSAGRGPVPCCGMKGGPGRGNPGGTSEKVIFFVMPMKKGGGRSVARGASLVFVKKE